MGTMSEGEAIRCQACGRLVFGLLVGRGDGKFVGPECASASQAALLAKFNRDAAEPEQDAPSPLGFVLDILKGAGQWL